jgi:hypothetical protein
MSDVVKILNLEVKPSVMPAHATTWLDDAKAKLQAHFDSRHGLVPVYDQAVVL